MERLLGIRKEKFKIDHEGLFLKAILRSLYFIYLTGAITLACAIVSLKFSLSRLLTFCPDRTMSTESRVLRYSF